METWHLYQIRDDDGELWVVAHDFGDAVRRWREKIRLDDSEVAEYVLRHEKSYYRARSETYLYVTTERSQACRFPTMTEALLASFEHRGLLEFEPVAVQGEA